MTFIGSMSGALLVQYVQADVLRQILPILVICIGLDLLMPKLGEEDRQRRMIVTLRVNCRWLRRFLRRILWPGCRVVLRAGLRYAVRI